MRVVHDPPGVGEVLLGVEAAGAKGDHLIPAGWRERRYCSTAINTGPACCLLACISVRAAQSITD